MSDFILGKSMFDMHPETMPQYIEALKWGDYKWQILNRLLLLYQTFKDTMDMDTMAIITVSKEQWDKEEKSDHCISYFSLLLYTSLFHYLNL